MSKISKWLGGLYIQFWYHTEFWLTPLDRRPYTFIMKDWIFTHQGWFILCLGLWLGVLAVLACSGHGLITTILGVITGAIFGHLVWGAEWIEGQQEFPPYEEE